MVRNFHTAKFGQGGKIVRSYGAELLNIEQLKEQIPSIFAEEKHHSRSEKYSFIPTSDLLHRMAEEGFLPSEVRQGGSKDEEKRGFTKHLIRFRQQGGFVPVVNGDAFPEIILVNAHDGTSSYQLMSGWFRLVCSNGMIIADTCGLSIKVPHRGNVDDVIEASYKVVGDFPEQIKKVEAMGQIELTAPEQIAYAEAAASLRFDEEAHVSPESLLVVQRQSDVGNDLWRTFNRVQERLIRGGVRTRRRDANNRPIRGRSREVNNIGENVKLNQALWALTEKMMELKAN